MKAPVYAWIWLVSPSAGIVLMGLIQFNHGNPRPAELDMFIVEVPDPRRGAEIFADKLAEDAGRWKQLYFPFTDDLSIPIFPPQVKSGD